MRRQTAAHGPWTQFNLWQRQVILRKGDQKVLVTGASGFIGSNIKNYLISLGFELDTFESQAPQVDLNYLDYPATLGYVSRAKPNIVINCAAKRPQSNLRAQQSVSLNHQIVLNLASALENLEQEVQFIHLGSAAEYSPTSDIISETSECKPTSYYGQDKVVSTNFLIGLSANSPLKPVVLRPSTVYGRGQSPDMLIAMIRKAVCSGGKLHINNPSAVRDFLHVEDLAKACARVIGDRQSHGEVFNVATGYPRSVDTVLQMVSGITGRSVQSFATVGEEDLQPQSSFNLMISPYKFMARHGWDASIGLDAGLRDLFTNLEAKKL